MPAARPRPAALTTLLVALACGGPSGPPDVVLVVLDTTRADRLSLYDDARETSPALAALARESIVFERAYANSPWTLSSHASLFTGLLPVTHGATQENLHLDDGLETLAELLRARGYESAAFSNNSWVSHVTNLTQGFDRVFPLWRESEDAQGTPHPTNRAIRDWLTARETDRPFFLFVNYIEPHWPYAAPRAYQDRFIDPDVPDALRKHGSFTAIRWYAREPRPAGMLLDLRSRLYDAEVAYVDAVLGELVRILRELDLLDSSLLVVTSDHGENLGEKGHQGHSFTLYESTLRIPLLIRRPGGRDGGRVRTDPAQLTDVFATIAAAAGVEQRDPRRVGRDLLAPPPADPGPLVAEYYRPEMFLRRFPWSPDVQRRLEPFQRRIRSIRSGDHKLIWASDGRHELYDVRADPEERENLLEREPEIARRLADDLDALVRRLERQPAERRQPLETLDPEAEKSLRALGYLP